MDARNENPRPRRGQGTAVCSDGRDPIMAETRCDALSAACAFPQGELFGLVVGADGRTTTRAPCPRCRTTIATIGPGAGPHHAELRCLRGHFLKWLPKPGGAA
jgi:hypothetical protein